MRRNQDIFNDNDNLNLNLNANFNSPSLRGRVGEGLLGRVGEGLYIPIPRRMGLSTHSNDLDSSGLGKFDELFHPTEIRK